MTVFYVVSYSMNRMISEYLTLSFYTTLNHIATDVN